MEAWRKDSDSGNSIDWFKAKSTGKSHISWENLWFPVDLPLSQPIDPLITPGIKHGYGNPWENHRKMVAFHGIFHGV